VTRHRVTKTYGHELGLSATFRQHRAKSHCRFIHGYALGFKLVFEADRLDENGWVKDFGGLKPLKARLIETFDHRMLVAEDDPQIVQLMLMDGARASHGVDFERVAQITVVEHVGCEAFARMVHGWAEELITPEERARGVRLVEVECREHAGNAASYMGTN
jgi:6-pyruvoyltetrahydropterin/6-carboxytetrahydropterin synthase